MHAPMCHVCKRYEIGTYKGATDDTCGQYCTDKLIASDVWHALDLDSFDYDEWYWQEIGQYRAAFTRTASDKHEEAAEAYSMLYYELEAMAKEKNVAVTHSILHRIAGDITAEAADVY